MARRSEAPRPGSYTGRVGGYPAIFVIDGEAVWYVPRKSTMRGFIQHSDAWDVSNGGFTPTYRGKRVAVRIAPSSFYAPE